MSPCSRAALVVCVLSSGWHTKQDLALRAGVSERAVRRMMSSALDIGLPLLHRESSTAGPMVREYRIASTMDHDIRPGVTPIGRTMALTWALSRGSFRKDVMARYLGVSERSIKRYLRAIEDAGIMVVGDHFTRHGGYNPFKVYSILSLDC